MDELELEKIIGIQKLGFALLDKPVIVGGLAMEYYGLRRHGDDIDFIVTDRDQQRLKIKFPAISESRMPELPGLPYRSLNLFRKWYLRWDHLRG